MRSLMMLGGLVRSHFNGLTAIIGACLLAACGGGSGGSQATQKGPSIQILGLEPGDSTVRGSVRGVDGGSASVVLYAKTDQWYVQPLRDAPFTSIAADGTWKNSTHPWERMVALLVDQSYRPRNTLVTHPASDGGVLAFDESPSRSADRMVDFAGLRWIVKAADLAGPGPNYFSGAPESVWVDGDGLHLTIRRDGDRWYASEVFSTTSLGYGTYRFTVDSSLDALDEQAVFAGFVYEAADREIDIEFSRFLAAPMNAQYVIQPYGIAGNLERFDMPGTIPTTHQFTWSADRVDFKSWIGDRDEPEPDDIIAAWTYTGASIPPPGQERMHFNFWLFDGRPPRSGKGDEIVIRAFHHEPG